MDVFDKPESFDPCIDPIVRVQAKRLREKILEYYEGPGRFDDVWIGLGDSGYQPEFRLRDGAEAEASGAAPTGRPTQAAVVAETETQRLSRTIAVLPFVDLSPDDDNRKFCSALTDQIITDLARQRDFQVASAGAIAQYNGRWVDVRQIGEDLSVKMVLEGSAQRCGERVRVRVQLANAASRLDVWGGVYDRNWDNLLDIQDDIAAAIVKELRSELCGTVSSHAEEALH
ncbi:MAG: hypothetical protein GC160_01645 [Acidobacteria bacterium]|nr:hypothetical protein [Acidobacteriota bacterium]